MVLHCFILANHLEKECNNGKKSISSLLVATQDNNAKVSGAACELGRALR